MNRTYYKFGIDDTGRKNVHYKGKNITWMNPCLDKWKAMICRCYSEKALAKFPGYRGVAICDEWHYLSNFERWMLAQDWEGNELDKDFLSYGEKIYSPETCAFIPKRLNHFIGDSASRRGDYPLGVSFSKGRNKYAAYIRRNGKSMGLGRFKTPQEAHQAYQKAKLEAGRELYADLIGTVDPRAMRSFDNILNKLQHDIAANQETASLHPSMLPDEWKLNLPAHAPYPLH